MHEYPVVVREIGDQNRLGVEDADDLDANLREVVAEGYERVNVDARSDGERVGTVVADDANSEVVEVRWER